MFLTEFCFDKIIHNVESIAEDTKYKICISHSYNLNGTINYSNYDKPYEFWGGGGAGFGGN